MTHVWHILCKLSAKIVEFITVPLSFLKVQITFIACLILTKEDRDLCDYVDHTCHGGYPYYSGRHHRRAVPGTFFGHHIRSIMQMATTFTHPIKKAKKVRCARRHLICDRHFARET